MAGYDPNRPRPTDSGAFIGLPGDPLVNHPEPDSQKTREGEFEVDTVTGGGRRNYSNAPKCPSDSSALG